MAFTVDGNELIASGPFWRSVYKVFPQWWLWGTLTGASGLLAALVVFGRPLGWKPPRDVAMDHEPNLSPQRPLPAPSVPRAGRTATTPITQSQFLQPPVSVEISVDLTCCACGYNLRGLLVGGRCPECADPVEASIIGEGLRFCDPAWVRTLSRGTSWICAALVITLADSVLMAIPGFGRVLVHLTLRTGMVPHLSILFMILTLTPQAITVGGSWLLTAREPRDAGHDRHAAARRIIRVTLIMGLAGLSVGYYSAITSVGLTTNPVARLFVCVPNFASIIGLIGVLQYYQRIARRIPAPRLSALAAILRLALPGCLLAQSVLGFCAVNFSGSNPAVLSARMGLWNALRYLSICFLGLQMIYLLTLLGVSRRLREQLALAKAHWAVRSDPGYRMALLEQAVPWLSGAAANSEHPRGQEPYLTPPTATPCSGPVTTAVPGRTSPHPSQACKAMMAPTGLALILPRPTASNISTRFSPPVLRAAPPTPPAAAPPPPT